MDVIFLHGPPAAGKYTIAMELAGLGAGQVFHNHLTVDAARPFFEFGSADFWALVRELRLTCFRLGASGSPDTVIYTSCYDHPSDLPFFESIESIVLAARGQMLPVFLDCSPAELERRVADPSRVEMGKLRSVEGLRRQLTQWNCIAVPRETCIAVSTDGRSPASCAQEICERLSLL